MSTITIKDEWQDVFPEHVNQMEYELHEVPRKSTHKDVTIVTHQTLGPQYLDMRLMHNGYKSGDSGNGGLVELEIKTDYMHMYGSNSININHTESGFVLTIEGEWERLQLVKVLQTALDELKTIKYK